MKSQTDQIHDAILRRMQESLKLRQQFCDQRKYLFAAAIDGEITGLYLALNMTENICNLPKTPCPLVN